MLTKVDREDCFLYKKKLIGEIVTLQGYYFISFSSFENKNTDVNIHFSLSITTDVNRKAHKDTYMYVLFI
jgi:hypothetical protein